MRFLPGVSIDDGASRQHHILAWFPANNSSMALNGVDVASARGNSRAHRPLIPMVNVSQRPR